MPFPEQSSRSFTRENIEALQGKQDGVYGLFKTNVWVYIGRGDIRQHLLDHLNGDNPCITSEGPTHWVDEVTANHFEREKELLAEYQTTCNKQLAVPRGSG